jgi:hypothetical protein
MRWDDQRGEFSALLQLGSIKSMPLIPYRERHFPHEVGRVNATLCVTNQFSLGFLRNRFSLFLSIASIIEDIISLPNFLTDPPSFVGSVRLFDVLDRDLIQHCCFARTSI